MIGDGWRLAVGTFTALPVRAPSRVDRPTARTALLLAPLAVLPLGLLVALVGTAGTALAVPPLAVALCAVAAVALATRALHWDGLGDVADGLTASYDRARSLSVMRSGTAGPAGVVAVVLVISLQAAALAPLLTTARGCLTAAVVVVAARWALLLTCTRGVPAARPDGLGVVMAGVVPRAAAVVAWLAVTAATGGLAGWPGVAAAVVAVVVVGLVTHRAVRRFGGVTGDVYGAAIELATAALLLGCSAGGSLGGP